MFSQIGTRWTFPQTCLLHKFLSLDLKNSNFLPCIDDITSTQVHHFFKPNGVDINWFFEIIICVRTAYREKRNQSTNGAEAHATISRIPLSDSIYPMYTQTYICTYEILNKHKINIYQNHLIFTINFTIFVGGLSPHNWKLWQHIILFYNNTTKALNTFKNKLKNVI